jgi:hypothetical protein
VARPALRRRPLGRRRLRLVRPRRPRARLLGRHGHRGGRAGGRWPRPEPGVGRGAGDLGAAVGVARPHRQRGALPAHRARHRR